MDVGSYVGMSEINLVGDVGSLTTHPISDTVIENHFQAKIS